MKQINMKQLLIAPIAFTIIASSASAAIVATAQISASGSIVNPPGSPATPYDADIRADDLINGATPTVSGSFGFDAQGLYDGVTYGGGSGIQDGTSYFNSSNPVTFTFTLTGSASGYDITTITSIAGWYTNGHNHAAQNYEVLVSTMTVPTYTALTLTGDVSEGRVLSDSATTGGYASKITIENEVDPGVAAIATGVTGIQFVIYRDAGDSVYHEIDVIGTATAVPEPSAALLGGLGALLLLRRRRH